MSVATPQLTPIRSTTFTVFDRFGNTRDAAGRPLARVQCKKVGPDGNSPIEPRYTGSPATARDLDALVEQLDALGCDFRIRQVFRSNREQQEVFTKYQNWRAAGCPKPGAARWSNTTMSTAAASAPNRSHHGWGGAMDIGLGNLQFGDGVSGDAALARFWDLAAEHGFTPIISEPRVNRSEAWHFDHLGPMKAVRDLFYAHRAEKPEYASAAGHAAEVGCILMGTHTGMSQMARMVQARLLSHGVFTGLPDGKIGPMTLRGLAAVGITTTGTLDAATAIARLNELEIGTAALAAL